MVICKHQLPGTFDDEVPVSMTTKLVQNVTEERQESEAARENVHIDASWKAVNDKLQEKVMDVSDVKSLTKMLSIPQIVVKERIWTSSTFWRFFAR